jgi:hypothetical protein
MHRLNQLLLIISLTLWCTKQSSHAADQDNQEKPPPPPVRHIYDVTELVRDPFVDIDASEVLPPTELGASRRPEARSQNSSQQARDLDSVRSRLEEIRKLIQSEIDPVSWRDAGGSESSMLAYDTRLIITTRAENHAQISQMLAELQKQSSRPVRLRATWAALTDDELKAVLDPPSETNNNNAGVRIVNLAALDRMKDAVRYRAEINTLHGQRVNVTAGRARSVLSGLDAVVGNGAAALEPTIDLVLAGACLQVRPILSADSSTVTLDLRCVISRWDPADAPPLKIPQAVASTQPTGAPAAPPPPATQPAPAAEIERLNMPVQLLATTARIPTGRAALIGGMTADHGAKDDHRPLYLIIEATAATEKLRDK